MRCPRDRALNRTRGREDVLLRLRRMEGDRRDAQNRAGDPHLPDVMLAGRAKATIFDPAVAPRKLPPPAATTTYWRLSLPRNVTGTECAHAGSSVSQSCLPVF